MSTQPNLDKFMVKVQGGRMYLSVAGRLVWFRQERPDWGIVTEAVEINHEKQYAIFRATIYTPTGQIMATATKKEDVKGFGDWIEKAETGSIGRALNLCGFGTDDMEETPRQRDQPPAQQRPRQAAQPAGATKPAGASQLSDPVKLSPADAGEYRRKAQNILGRWAKDIQEEWSQYIRETYDADSIKEVEDNHIYALWKEIVEAQKEAQAVAAPASTAKEPETKPETKEAPAHP